MSPITEKSRRLGIAISILLALGGWIFLVKDLAGAFILSAGAVLVLILSFFKPVFLQVPAKMWLGFINILFFVIANIFFICLYFLIVTPIGLVGRVFGNVFLSQKVMSASSSYWHKSSKSYWTASKKIKVHPMRW